MVYLADPGGSLNTTQNLNRMLLDSHNACAWDFKDNEFSPEDWYGGNVPPTVCFKTDTTTPEQPVQSFSQSLSSASSTLASSSDGPFVGSAKSDKYHYPSCSAAKKIKPSNLVTFASSADARAQGYVPCGICHPP